MTRNRTVRAALTGALLLTAPGCGSPPAPQATGDELPRREPPPKAGSPEFLKIMEQTKKES